MSGVACGWHCQIDGAGQLVANGHGRGDTDDANSEFSADIGKSFIAGKTDLFPDLLGYLLRKLGLKAAPLILGFVLGLLIEGHFRRAMTLSDGDVSVFATRPLAATLLVPCLVLLPLFGRQRGKIFLEEN